MEQNLPVKAKRFWHIVRAALFMLRRSISKSKLLADLSMMMKLGKITGKAIANLMFNHLAAASSAAISRGRGSHRRHLSFTPNPDDYEFSCSNSPAASYPTFQLPFKSLSKWRKKAHPEELTELDHEVVAANVVMKAIKMLQSETASPVVWPGFGRSPVVRQLRVTDSPYPLKDDGGDGGYVDEAAEQFIKKFYNNLRGQNDIAWEHDDRF